MKKYTLVGIDGNAFSIMGYVKRAMRECGCAKEEIDEYIKKATSSDYNNLLCVSMSMLTKLNEDLDDFNPMSESKHVSK